MVSAIGIAAGSKAGLRIIGRVVVVAWAELGAGVDLKQCGRRSCQDGVRAWLREVRHVHVTLGT